MNIVSKYRSTCPRCYQPIEPGTRVEWEPGTPALHLDCEPAPARPARPEARVDGSSIVAFLQAAQARGLKWPKVRFLGPDNEELRLYLAGPSSKYPGSLQVKRADEWLGRIEPTGRATHGLTGLLPTLEAIAADPAGAARRFAALTGRCSFCDLPLTDDGSVEVGYGPICAKRFGLPHTPKGTRTLRIA